MNVDQTKHANLVSTDPKTSKNELTSGFDFKINPKATSGPYFLKKFHHVESEKWGECGGARETRETHVAIGRTVSKGKQLKIFPLFKIFAVCFCSTSPKESILGLMVFT